MRSATRFLFLAALGVSLGSAPAGTPTDDLMDRVPPEAAVVLVIENFADRSREVLASPLVARLRGLPAVREWAKSDGAAALRKSRSEIESGIGMTLDQVRDDLLGDCVVLALVIPPDAEPGDASGILMSRVRDRERLATLIAALNKSETDEGTLKAVVEIPKAPGMPTIHHRIFRAGKKPDEWYAVLPDGTFVWSNSETLLTGAVASKAGEGYGSSARYRSVRDALPPRSLAKFYTNPRLILDAASRSKDPPDPRVAALLGGLESVGAALEWRGGPIVHLVETIDREKMPAAFRPASGGREPDPIDVRRVPRGVIAAAAWRWDLPATYDALLSLVPPRDRPQVMAAQAVAQGFLLGKDLRRDLLPAIGPGGFAHVEARPGSIIPALVASFDLRDRKDVADAIENGMRTIASLSVFEMNRKDLPGRLEVEERDGVRVTALVGAEQNFAFATGPRRVALGSDAAIVRGAMTDPVAADAGREGGAIARLRAEYFPRSDAFVAIDLDALHGFASERRGEIVRRESQKKKLPEAEVGRDFGKALHLLGSFDGAFASWDFARDGRSMHQAIGLIGRRDPPSR